MLAPVTTPRPLPFAATPAFTAPRAAALPVSAPAALGVSGASPVAVPLRLPLLLPLFLLLHSIQIAPRCYPFVRVPDRLPRPQLPQHHHDPGGRLVRGLKVSVDQFYILFSRLWSVLQCLRKLPRGLIVQAVLLLELFDVLVHLRLPDERAFLHLLDLHGEQAGGVPRGLQDVPQRH